MFEIKGKQRILPCTIFQEDLNSKITNFYKCAWGQSVLLNYEKLEQNMDFISCFFRKIATSFSNFGIVSHNSMNKTQKTWLHYQRVSVQLHSILNICSNYITFDKSNSTPKKRSQNNFSLPKLRTEGEKVLFRLFYKGLAELPIIKVPYYLRNKLEKGLLLNLISSSWR